jgi:hypothetical protein
VPAIKDFNYFRSLRIRTKSFAAHKMPVRTIAVFSWEMKSLTLKGTIIQSAPKQYPTAFSDFLATFYEQK